MDRRDSGVIAFFALHPVAGNLLMLLMIIFGLFGLSNLNRQVMPDFDMDMIRIAVEWPGASPQDVEANVIEAIEPEVRFLDGIDRVDSTAFEGRADITLTFREQTDMARALADVQSAVARITTLPVDMERPVVTKLSNFDTVCRIEITGPYSEQALKLHARRIRDDLIERGLTSVVVNGARESELWVEVSQARLRELDLSLDDIARRIGAASVDLPSGSVESGGRSRQIRSEGLARTPRELGAIEVVSRATGEKIALREIAAIHERFKENTVSRFVDGQPSIGLTVTRSKGLDSIIAQRAVAEYLEEIRPALPESLRVEMYDVFAVVVTDRVNMLLSNGFTGLLLVLAALYLFLNGRIAFWVAVGIPTAILMTLGIMNLLGMTLNMISMFAIIMGLGIMVDDAIVVGERTETLHRRGLSASDATLEGARSMFAPVLAACLTTVAAFAPLLLVGATIGRVINDLPVMIILIIIASLIECFLILPMHLRGALTRMDRAGGPKRSRFLLAFNRFRDGHFTRALEWACSFRYSVVTATVCAFLIALATLLSGRVGFEFFATPETDVVHANFTFSPGTPREQSVRMLRELERAAYVVEEQLAGGPGELIVYAVGSVAATEGRPGEAVRGSDHMGNVTLEFIPSDRRSVRNAAFLRAWQAEVKPLAGIESLVMLERSAGGPPGKDIDIRLYGADLETLKAAAMAARDNLRNIPGVQAIEDNLPWGKQEQVLALTPAGKALGFTTEDVARQVRNAYEGAIAQRFARDEEEVLVRVMLPREERGIPLRDLYLRSPAGRQVPLTEVAAIDSRLGFSEVRREDGVREVSVSADVDKEISTSNAVLATFRDQYLDELEARYAVAVSFKGRAEEQADASSDVGKALVVSLLTMYIILAWVFGSYRAPLVVMSIIPFGFVGAIFGHWVMGFNLGMFSLFALLGLGGVMINDSIILVTAIRKLLAEGKALSEAVVLGTRDRLRPVLLTTLTTVGGLTPLMFETSLQAQLVQPLAITLVFGMMFSPLLVLFFVPALLSIGGDLQAHRGATQGGSVINA